jgi:hypothetical protein
MCIGIMTWMYADDGLHRRVHGKTISPASNVHGGFSRP